MASTSDTTRAAVAETGGCNVSGYDLPDERTSDKPAAMRPKDRVRKYRSKLHEQQRRRLEACIDTSLIEETGQIARSNHEPLWSTLAKALEAYVDEYRALEAERPRLTDESTRLRGQPDSPEWRRQVEEYNRELAVYRKRLARFRQPRSPLGEHD